jgi:hypothetical protein
MAALAFNQRAAARPSRLIDVSRNRVIDRFSQHDRIAISLGSAISLDRVLLPQDSLTSRIFDSGQSAVALRAAIVLVGS